MTSTKERDPRYLPVQISIRVPFWYKEQLQALADDAGSTLPAAVVDLCQRTLKPRPPA